MEKKNKKIFKWSGEMIEYLVGCILNYKIKCDFNSIDFDANKSMQYKEICKSMTNLLETCLSYFGQEILSTKPAEITNKEITVYKQKLPFGNNLMNKG